MFTRVGARLESRFVGQAMLLCGLATFAAAQTITIQSITPLPIQAVAINAYGDVAGWLLVAGNPFVGIYHAVVYSQGVVTDLGVPNGSSFDNSYATAINDTGQVAGYIQVGSRGSAHAFLYDRAVMRDLGTLGGQSSWATRVNASGEVVGYSYIDPSGYYQAFLYSGGAMHGLGALVSGGYSGALAIDDAGNVVGWSWTDGTGWQDTHAFVYQNGVMHDLGTLPLDNYSEAEAINASGQITGRSSSFTPGSPGNVHLFLYTNGVMADLGNGGVGSIIPTGINASGQIVAYGYTPRGSDALLYTSASGIVDLNSLLPPNSGWVLEHASAINDAGQIVGDGIYLGQNSSFLLSIGTGSSPVTTATISGPSGINGWYVGAVSVTLSATSSGNPVSATYLSVDGAAYQLYAGPFPVAGDGTHQVSYYSVDTAGSQETAVHQTVRTDATKPVSHVAALSATAATPSFNVTWSGADATSGVATYTIFAADNGGAFASWISGTTATQATYSGVAGHSYGFYSIATDVAGNREPAKTSPEAVTVVPARPVSHVAPLPPTAAAANFTVQWSGSAPGVGIRNYTIYASDNGGAFTPWLSATAGTQATYSGVCEHNYGFYSIATDNIGLQEVAKTAAEATTRIPFNPVSHVLALPAIAPSPNFNVQWAAVNTCTPIRTWDIYVSDNGGAFTTWKARTSAKQAYFSGLLGHTYGFYSIAFDNGGSAEAPKSSADAMTQTPLLMAADVNSDGRIDCTDVSIVKAAIGTRTGQAGFNARADLNGDGLVDVRDLAIVTQKLTPGTTCP